MQQKYRNNIIQNKNNIPNFSNRSSYETKDLKPFCRAYNNNSTRFAKLIENTSPNTSVRLPKTPNINSRKNKVPIEGRAGTANLGIIMNESSQASALASLREKAISSIGTPEKTNMNVGGEYTQNNSSIFIEEEGPSES